MGRDREAEDDVGVVTDRDTETVMQCLAAQAAAQRDIAKTLTAKAPYATGLIGMHTRQAWMWQLLHTAVGNGLLEKMERRR